MFERLIQWLISSKFLLICAHNILLVYLLESPHHVSDDKNVIIVIIVWLAVVHLRLLEWVAKKATTFSDNWV